MLIREALSAYQSNELVVFDVVLIGLAFMTSGVIAALSSFLTVIIGHKIVYSIRKRLIHKILLAPYSTMVQFQGGDIAARITSDAYILGNGVTEGFVQLLVGILSSLVILIMMMYLSWQLSLASLVVLAFVVGCGMLILPRLQNAITKMQEAVGELSSNVASIHEGSAEVRIYQAEKMAISPLLGKTIEAYKAGRRSAKASACIGLLSTSSVQLMLIVIVGLAVLLLHNHLLDMPTAVSFVMYVLYLMSPIGSIINGIRVVATSMAAGPRIDKIMDLPTDKNLLTSFRQNSSHLEEASTLDLWFENVSFEYPGDSDLSLENIDFHVPAGSMVGIVGESGSGKSSLLSLIAGFYGPTQGRIKLGESYLDEMSLFQQRSYVTYARQKPWMAPASVQKNLLYGMPETVNYVTKNIKLMELLNVDKVVAALPFGIDTEIGKNNDSLSGGEIQRLSVIRALNRSTEILLLDEITSSLDGLNERLTLDLLRSIRGRRTVLMATHRLSVAKECDFILLLEKGRIKAFGPAKILFETNRDLQNLFSFTPAH